MGLKFETFCSLLGLLSSKGDVSPDLLRMEHVKTNSSYHLLSHGWMQPCLKLVPPRLSYNINQ